MFAEQYKNWNILNTHIHSHAYSYVYSYMAKYVDLHKCIMYVCISVSI